MATSTVGALTLPLEAGRAQEKLADPIVAGLLDFLAWSLNTQLNAKLAQLNGTSSIAVPDANAHDWNPLEPRGHKVKLRVPTFHVWWPGQSTDVQFTVTKRQRTRNVHAMYIAEELPTRAALDLRSGLFNAVDSVLSDACNNGSHPDYSYGNDPLGMPLTRSIGAAQSWDFSYMGSQAIQRIGIDDPNTTKVGTKVSGRDYPALVAVIAVREMVTRRENNQPMADAPINICNNGVEILGRTLTYPDGSNAPENA